MWDFYRNLSKAEQNTIRTLGRYAAMMFTVPVAIAMTLPVFIRTWGIDPSLSVLITAGSATLSVFGIAVAFSYMAYYEDERTGESQAKYIMSKPIKGD
ncbi:hypothetical protein X943_002454 [Babesia divergens]|uniref:Uncharacterized protein n=1 Tax=Babesia divergens TaxID=32595 RepID=A0AAD9GDA1_BABDI|nr:hypothetical protein X943_002454 [Babesia divergens]